jgi:hypothetical protein
MATDVDVDSASELSASDAERLVGQTVSRVKAWEYGFTLIFADGSKVEVSGNQYGDCALGVEFTPPALEQDN